METELTETTKTVVEELPADLAELCAKHRTYRSTYPFAKMSIGEWVLLATHENESLENAHKRIQSAVGAFRRNAKSTSFQVRIAKERGQIFVRRVEDKIRS